MIHRFNPVVKKDTAAVVAVSADGPGRMSLSDLRRRRLRQALPNLHRRFERKNLWMKYYSHDEGRSRIRKLPAGNLLRASHYSKTDCRNCEKGGRRHLPWLYREKEMIRSVSSWQSKRLRLRWIIAPWRFWELNSRERDRICRAAGIPLKITKETNYSKDKNLWHLSTRDWIWRIRPTKRRLANPDF